MVSTVMSIVEDRDLDLRNQLHNDPNQAADQTALGVNGEWFPLHEYLMPVMTVPLFLLGGINGCLFFNVIVNCALMMLLYYLCARHVQPLTAFVAVTLIAFSTLFLDYSYSYSLDVFAAFLLVAAYSSLVSGRPVLAGFVWGLAVLGRM